MFPQKKKFIETIDKVDDMVFQLHLNIVALLPFILSKHKANTIIVGSSDVHW